MSHDLFDRIVALVALVLLAPILVAIALAVRLTSPGPVLFRQVRVGLAGKEFRILKFRTMVDGADRLAANITPKGDPRVTPVGRWLRGWYLDELPQLWNVLRGDMSLVGPRPVVSEELARYGDNLPYYFESTPGLTGLWQISGRNDIDYRRRVHLDCWYVKNWSLWYDLVILLKTIPIVVFGRGAY